MNDNYQPYGEEWEKEMSKFPKGQLIKMLGEAFRKDTSIFPVDDLRKANPFRDSSGSHMAIAWDKCCDKAAELLNQK